jgi:nucleoside 2-deoxyribosyltransferase
MKKVFIICSVRGTSDDYKVKLESYVAGLEAVGNKVHLPHRDTDQAATGLAICTQNMEAIRAADEVHIFYNKGSQGTHFDMGVAFASRKLIKIVENEPLTAGKSYQNMLVQWEGLG